MADRAHPRAFTRFRRTAGSGSFNALRHRGFRVFFIGRFASGTGVWFQRIAQDWLVLELTGDSGALGVTIAVQFLPVIAIGLWGGVLADRLPKKRIIVVTQLVIAFVALSLGVLVLTSTVAVWHVMVCAVVLGAATAVENPTRLAFIGELVPSAALHDAISLDSAAFQAARLFGPAAGGIVMLYLGIGWSFLATFAGCLALVLNLYAIKPAGTPTESSQPKPAGGVRDGLRYVRRRPTLLWTIVLVGVIGTFAINHVVVIAAYATEILHASAGIFGLMNTVLGVGALLGAFGSALIGRSSPMLVAGAALVLCATQLTAALAETRIAVLLWLLPMGALSVFTLAAASSLTAAEAHPAYRGRVIALYSIVLVGGIPIGSPVVGWVISQFGARAGFQLGNGIAAVGVLCVGTVLWSYDRRTSRGRHHADDL